MTETKKANHQVNVVRLGAPRVHTNADTLELFDIDGYQVVTKKGNFKEGDLAIYIQPDSVVPQTEPFRFIWADYLKRPEMCQHQAPDGQSVLVINENLQHCVRCQANVLFNGETSLPDSRRRITVRKFRKEWSEGLLMPLSDFDQLLIDYFHPNGVGEGTDVSDALGITHYIAADDVVSTNSGNAGKKDQPQRRYPKTLRGWFFFLLHKIGIRNRQYNEEIAFNVPDFDVENFKNFKNVIQFGEEVIVTEKLHGSQGKYVYVDGRMFAGSRNFWKSPKSDCVWRKALVQNDWIERFCREHEGMVLYGEVVPTQKGFNYGCENGEVKFFVFDIRHASGNYVNKAYALNDPYITTVPVIYHGPAPSDLAAEFADGRTQVKGANHIREGVVVTVADQDPQRRVRGLGRIQLKIVSNAFLEKDSK